MLYGLSAVSATLPACFELFVGDVAVGNSLPRVLVITLFVFTLIALSPPSSFAGLSAASATYFAPEWREWFAGVDGPGSASPRVLLTSPLTHSAPSPPFSSAGLSAVSAFFLEAYT